MNTFPAGSQVLNECRKIALAGFRRPGLACFARASSPDQACSFVRITL